MEISGGADPALRLKPFASSLKGIVGSMGVNHKELGQLALIGGYARRDSRGPLPRNAPEVCRRYRNALRLVKEVGLERLHIHGNDVDLIIRRGASEAALQQELYADLFTKAAVIVSILLRKGLDPQTYPLPRVLYHKGFRALIEVGWQISKDTPRLTPQTRRHLFKQFVENGYYLAPGRSHYSLVAVPVMWPEEVDLDRSLNTTGAADTCSGISLIYSGWR